MGDPRLPRRLYLFLVLVCLLMLGYYYPQMPQRMASHFAADGSPNGWQPRDSFFLMMFVICASSAIVTFFAPWQIASSNDARINLPNKESKEEVHSFDSAVTIPTISCNLSTLLSFGFVSVPHRLA